MSPGRVQRARVPPGHAEIHARQQTWTAIVMSRNTVSQLASACSTIFLFSVMPQLRAGMAVFRWARLPKVTPPSRRQSRGRLALGGGRMPPRQPARCRRYGPSLRTVRFQLQPPISEALPLSGFYEVFLPGHVPRGECGSETRRSLAGRPSHVITGLRNRKV